MKKKLILNLYIIAILCISSNKAFSNNKSEILANYSNIAHATYEDSLITAKIMNNNITDFLNKPSKKKFEIIKNSWLDARVRYQQSEVFRFGNSIVDDWEGKVNAWPLDEGLIDYVQVVESDSENKLYNLNVISNKYFKVSGKTIDANLIDKNLLENILHEADKIEANVATGYHAIEFLLWGQDLNGMNHGAGERPYTDYDLKNCTNSNCERRANYLRVVSALLIDDLEDMVNYWKENGEARLSLLSNIDVGIESIIQGIGSLSYGELAGERIKLGLLLNDPEEEHDCFSDNTHNSHFYNQVGIVNVFYGKYERHNGEIITGPSLSGLAKEIAPQISEVIDKKIELTNVSMNNLKKRAENVEAYDQMLHPSNAEGNAVLNNVVNSLVNQSIAFEDLTLALGLDLQFEGSDSLNNPDEVFK